jgi:1,4-alpha-glucan branching enzyme
MLLARYWSDPFAFLGMHVRKNKGGLVIRASFPSARCVYVQKRDSGRLREMARVDNDGIFELVLPHKREPFDYFFVVDDGSERRAVEDPYRFGPVLGDIDAYLIAEGTHYRLWDVLGSHRRTIDGVDGVAFAVWAPNAARVSVVGDFNRWDGRCHPMRKRIECGVWEIFVPHVPDGARYKYEIEGPNAQLLALKADPFARHNELRPATASIVWTNRSYAWSDGDWMRERGPKQHRDAPIAAYEVHLGSWRRRGEESNRFLTYRELAHELLPYVREMGFTHIEVLPVCEHPFDGSWGYQPTGMFAPTSRYGTPEDFAYFVDRAHQLGIGVILDWVPGHFPNDPHGLAFFDGTHLYEHEDPRKGFHPDWNTLIYNYGRREVANFLIASALFWVEEFHVDALRVDAVASMLYLDYSRRPGEWVPNVHGGNENVEAIAFIRRLNETLFGRQCGITTIAEESTAWPMVSMPADAGGLGFGFKWNMGWMHDTLRYFGFDPVYRRYHQSDLTFGLVYAFSENYVLPLSHDEVVHGKRSLLEKMPGDRWQKFANLRMLLGLMYTHPGKKLLFMGSELALSQEWNHDAQLDWDVLHDDMHAGVCRLVRDCNALYRSSPALYSLDADPHGFEWIDDRDAAVSVLSFARRGVSPGDEMVVVMNATPVVRHGYRIGVSRAGMYREVLNTDSHFYGGGNVGNGGSVAAQTVPSHGRPASLLLTLPPLAILVLAPE